ncbi:nucleotide sugar dehydrogenase [Pseudaquidulcibacter saccharophilus]|uniref:nucleotide sugar dehydrogenase n=1 Tax=Pseudaquidulcibacter saccharophilus TaxID=2831900 RepID=UPI001EFF41BE|nr:nucleotide sugar dehydrogenase [Pseudaquidulcibacter saccharophilus]
MKVPFNSKDREVCIIGLGYVGLTLAVVMAEAGFKVTGVERNNHINDLVNSGKAHFLEIGLDARLEQQVKNGNLKSVISIDEVESASVYIITVGTPLVNNSKTTNLEAIKLVSEGVAKRLKADDIVILRSTVKIGVSRNVVKPLLDEAGVEYKLAFCPERTLEGKALAELVSLPQVVGGLDDASTMRASDIFGFLTPTIIRVTTLETAEIIKLINNTQRDLMFAFANEIAGYCDVVGISAREVINSANIGYPRSSLALPGPVGGPCLEKDPYILSEGIKALKGNPALALLGRTVNEELPKVTIENIQLLLDKKVTSQEKLKFTIAGLAFKGRPETSDLRGTLAIPIIDEIKRILPNVEIFGYDPACSNEEISSLGITPCGNLEDVFKDSSVLLFQNNNPAFEKLNLNSLSRLMRQNGIIYDLWSQFDGTSLELSNGVRYGGHGLMYLYNK